MTPTQPRTETPRVRMNRRLAELRIERSSWIPHWTQISDVLLPRSSRFLTTDTNRGQKKHNNILDNTPTRALRVQAAGMLSGMTSPARPWFRLALGDPELEKYTPVKVWLHEVQTAMLRVFQRSNTYRALHTHYLDLGAFGTSASILAADDVSLIHHHSAAIGEYCLATDYAGRVNTLYREFRRPVAEVISEFGYANCSPATRALYDRGSLSTWVELVHCIEPRTERDLSRKDARNMPFSSCYWEKDGRSETPLREGGYRRFPVLAARWETSGGDIYGSTCPGMDALGDMRQLQHEQLRKANAIDYQTKPPVQVPTSLKNSEIDTLPGGVTYFDGNGSAQRIQSLWDVRLDLNHLLVDIQDVRDRINAAFYADLFLMLATADKQMTATEVAERHEEKLLALGPVLERLHNELLDPLVESTFDALLAADMLPPPPPELQGVQLDIEFISMLAQAQRAVSTQAIDRYVANLGAVAQIKPEVLDRFDADRYVEIYADALGIDPSLIVPGDVAAVVRQQRAEQAAQAEQMAMANVGADTAQKLGGVPTQGGASNGLNDILGLFQGYSSPPAQTY
jgi:hypothetical protein